MRIEPGKNYLVKTRVDLGDFFGVPDEDAYVVLIEARSLDLVRLKEAAASSDEKLLTAFGEMLPGLIVEHNFTIPREDDPTYDRDMSAAEVATMLAARLGTYSRLAQKYGETILFTRGSKSDSK